MVANIIDEQWLSFLVYRLDLSAEDETAWSLPPAGGVLEFSVELTAEVRDFETHYIYIEILVYHPVQRTTGSGLDQVVRSGIFAGLDSFDAVKPGIVAKEELVPIYFLGKQFCRFPDEFVNPFDSFLDRKSVV